MSWTFYDGRSFKVRGTEFQTSCTIPSMNISCDMVVDGLGENLVEYELILDVDGNGCRFQYKAI